ncbi:MAG: efflux RND transporter periplasmic adaptor subunit, partial [Planctomycetota bacterium]
MHGSEVELTPEQLANAGIAVQTAGPGVIESVLRLTAVVAANEDVTVHVTPRVAGFVREIHKKLGELAKKGEPLCEIESVEVGGAISQYLRERALERAASQTLEKEAALFQQRIETQRRVLDGAIEIAQRIFDRERDLQDKAISTLRPYLEADKELQKARLAKEQELTELTSQRDTRLLQLQVELERATIAVHAAEERLRILGFSAGEIAKMAGAESEKEEQPGSLGAYTIRAPRSGLITDRHITYNEFVDTETKLFSLQDLSRVWVQASVYEKDIAQVSRGQKAILHVDAFPPSYASVFPPNPQPSHAPGLRLLRSSSPSSSTRQPTTRTTTPDP